MINKQSYLPIYTQLVNKILGQIEAGELVKGQQLLSIAQQANIHQTGKVTVAKAYSILREKGYILSKQGKGFFVSTSTRKVEKNIFLLFDTFSTYKEVLYFSLVKHLSPGTRVSIFFHHYNLNQFKSLIESSIGNYSYYVIMPHFNINVASTMQKIPSHKLLVMDKDVTGLPGDYAAVVQDFSALIKKSLRKARVLLNKYDGLKVILGFEHQQYSPQELIAGLQQFAIEEDFLLQIYDNLEVATIQKGYAYLIFSDNDLVDFIKYCKQQNWQPGVDIGLISFDDTPLKEVLIEGITVISTDFKQMGISAAEIINSGNTAKIINPGGFVKRASL
jgi:DNA-binding transcriptional regulator YhcF (GntR family)